MSDSGRTLQPFAAYSTAQLKSFQRDIAELLRERCDCSPGYLCEQHDPFNSPAEEAREARSTEAAIHGCHHCNEGAVGQPCWWCGRIREVGEARSAGPV
jgi:hypothetical protein